MSSALIAAIQCDSLNFIELLLIRGVDVNNYPVDEGSPALIEALLCDHNHLVEMLLLHSADVNICSHKGDTALAIAVRKQNLQLMQELIASRANVDLISQHPHKTPLMLAIELSNLEAIQILMQAGSNPNAVSSYHVPPIYIASSRGDTAIVDLLLTYKANVNLQNSYFDSALTVAVVNNHWRVVAQLAPLTEVETLQSSPKRLQYLLAIIILQTLSHVLISMNAAFQFSEFSLVRLKSISFAAVWGMIVSVVFAVTISRIIIDARKDLTNFLIGGLIGLAMMLSQLLLLLACVYFMFGLSVGVAAPVARAGVVCGISSLVYSIVFAFTAYTLITYRDILSLSSLLANIRYKKHLK